MAVLEDRVKRTEDRLMRQYSAMDSRLSTLNALGSYVSQQVSAWSKSGK
jgi:flagellar hook-associated protein 2